MSKLMMTLSLLAVASPALADPARPKSKLDPERIICRSDNVVGSRLQTLKVCMTARAWAEFSRDQRKDVEKIQRFEHAGG